MVSRLPVRMEDHWWQRPGRTPGRELSHWHVLFHDQPLVRELAARAQQRLAGLPGLDPIAPPWLHLTTYVVGFAGEVPTSRIEAMVAGARGRLAGTPPIRVRLGRVSSHPRAVVLPVEPLGALDPILEAVRGAAEAAGCPGHTDTSPWVPHVSVAYPNRSLPAGPVVAALGRRLPEIEAAIASVRLVAQTQVGRGWQWRPVAEVALRGGSQRTPR